MSFLRRASLARKKQDDEASPSPQRAPSISGDSSPQAHNSSEASSIPDDSSITPSKNNHGSKRKSMFGGKGRKRLSSLFASSSTLSSYANDREGTSSPQPKSRLNNSTTSSSSTSVRSNVTGSVRSTTAGAPAEGGIEFPQRGLSNLRIGTVTGEVTESPEASPTVESGSAIGARDAATKRTRRDSMWSQWELEGVGEDGSSSDEDDGFLTPSEGLSEVEEEDEDEVEPDALIQSAHPAAIAAATTIVPTAPPSDFKVEPTNVDKGAVVTDTKDVSGTGASTIHRSLPTMTETRVRRHVSHRPDASTVDQSAVLAEDIETCRGAIKLFLTSHMKEAEDFCQEKAGEGHHLYLQSAMGIIEALKGMMTFDSVDLHNALDICKSTSITASTLRRANDSVMHRLGGLVKSGGGLARIKAMTPLERHAELVYAEQSLLKAMLAIVAGGDWIGLVREALNMRTAHGIYRSLQQYLEDADKHGYDDDIDMDFRSGVLLGTGTSSLMLSLLPGKVLKIAEVFGYAGDRTVALNTLMAVGGWTSGVAEPSLDETNEGLRRPICDMILLAYHLVISVLIPISGIDVPLARNVLAYNMKRYPDGVFFLYFQARLHTTQCQPAEANQSLQKALDLQLEYVQLQHMCLWDYACNHMMMGNFKGALDCFSILKDESNWSRAVYTYAAAACIVEMIEDGHKEASLEEADKLMRQISKLTKKIAGKSLPIEKFSSRKARKFESQGGRLFLPALELAYVFGSLGNTPRRSHLDVHIPRLNAMLSKLEVGEDEYGSKNGKEYWDDYVLGHFLRGMCHFIARWQPKDAVIPEKNVRPEDPSDEELDQAAEKDFKAVIRHGPDVQLDHWILFHCYYELGRLYAQRGNDELAKHQFEIVMSGKIPDHNPYMAKAAGKYSLEGALLLKTHAALSAVKEREKERSGK
ncbi:hypothetical protein L198_02249 [Cryptococcus wingfieldii CBS 7118]|uniref:Tetratricopeptide repeat protein 39B n=1 Tax=Cryptococcus wingfieldii CBS 7118 TaxID=1295528 RepID=A0A1E3JTY9_9TREE|nr:hypothetical protein L198_02249 [Cryptococcus wingfieldii CBS 7118]ODO03402.1 hypothetical protein L198_02249 [Cryptococcus wingfieldii CBS 7118]